MEEDVASKKKELQEIFDPVTECPYSQEQIDEMKALGIPKPDEVTWPMWMGPKKQSHVHEAMIYAAASGATNKMIADEFGFTQHRMSIILNRPEIKKKIKAVQEVIWGGSAEKRFQNLLPKAITVAQDIIEDATEKRSLRADVAFKLMDRALGKPQQSISVEGNLLVDMIAKLDEQKSRDVSDTALASERDKDPVDEFVNNFIEADYKVGKRDKNG